MASQQENNQNQKTIEVNNSLVYLKLKENSHVTFIIIYLNNSQEH